MALFYFHFSNGRTVIRDMVGQPFPDLDTAQDAAKIALTRVVVQAVAAGHPFPDQTSIEICDASGRVLGIEWSWCLVREPTPFSPAPPPTI